MAFASGSGPEGPDPGISSTLDDGAAGLGAFLGRGLLDPALALAAVLALAVVLGRLAVGGALAAVDALAHHGAVVRGLGGGNGAHGEHRGGGGGDGESGLGGEHDGLL